MPDWTAADLAGMELCQKHGERLKFCSECSQGVSAHPAASKSAAGLLAPKAGVLPPALGRLPQPDMNKTERAYSQYLDLLKASGEIVYWEFEVLTVKLGTDLRLTPDFLVMLPSGRLEFHDTKGAKKIKVGRHAGETKPYIEEDARVKAIVTAAHFVIPMYLVWPESNGAWGKREL